MSLASAESTRACAACTVDSAATNLAATLQAVLHVYMYLLQWRRYRQVSMCPPQYQRFHQLPPPPLLGMHIVVALVTGRDIRHRERRRIRGDAASFTATDKEGSDPYILQAVAVVPFEGRLHEENGANHGPAGNPKDQVMATHVNRSEKESQAIREALSRKSTPNGRATSKSTSIGSRKATRSSARRTTRRAR